MPKTITSSNLTKKLQAKTAAKRKKHADHVAVAGAAASIPPLNDLQPDFVLERRKITALKDASRRVRKTAPEQVQRIIASIKAHGLMPILIDEHDVIIAGHVVVTAARAMGVDEIACVVVSHLTAEGVRSLRVALNRVGETGEWDLPALRLEMIELDELEIDLSATGFSLPEIDIIKLADDEDSDDESLDDDAEPNDGVVPVSRPGDLFALGKHRLLCGDSLAQASYAKLLEGKKVACVFSDPPFNIAIDGFLSSLGKIKHKDFAMGVGEMDRPQFQSFLQAYLQLCCSCCISGAIIFAFMDWRSIDLLMAAGKAAGLQHVNTALWYKGAGGMGGLYRSAHELVAIFCNGLKPAINNVELGKNGRDRTNVWTYAGANRKGSSAADALKDHPTPKPVPLVADALLDVTLPGDAVLDPFMGSGTTILAAEQTGRVAYGIELDPKYVDVAIRRWQDKSGLDAVHVETGLTWAQLQVERAADGQDPPILEEAGEAEDEDPAT